MGMRSRCERCGSDFVATGARGRTPRFCSGRCRVSAHRAKPTLPAALTSLPRWTARDGKRPVRPDGRAASSTDPTTWCTYAQVADQPHGIMLGDGLGCYDLDGVIDDGGQLHPDAAAVLNTVGDTALWVE